MHDGDEDIVTVTYLCLNVLRFAVMSYWIVAETLWLTVWLVDVMKPNIVELEAGIRRELLNRQRGNAVKQTDLMILGQGFRE